jgi:hypothetical protein
MSVSLNLSSLINTERHDRAAAVQFSILALSAILAIRCAGEGAWRSRIIFQK